MASDAVVGDAGDRVPLLSRSAELARFDELLDRAARHARDTAKGEESRGTGRSQVVDIMGAAGIGKSRLLGEVCARARRRGLTVLRGRATEV